LKIESKAEFLEELIVRRELSMNFVYYNKNYDSIKGIPEWVSNFRLIAVLKIFGPT
jgi:deoxyribodipyrimidine photo-lyase